MSEVRVRFAPSPTGNLHIGGARTALFNWLFARNRNGKFILRIEDTDIKRSTIESADGIIEGLKWLGIDWDEGPYFQSERQKLYKDELHRLIEKGYAYYCYCTPEELAHEREEAAKLKKPYRYSGKCRNLSEQQIKEYKDQGRKPVLRLKVPMEGQVVVNDLIRGKVAFRNDILDDFIIMKSNGTPAYNFACVVDDNSMGINYVIRAEEHLSNTPKQLLLYEYLGYDIPQFAHVPMILAPDRSKLSKRHGATSVQEFRDQGYLPEAIVNYLTLLGWSDVDGREKISLDETAKVFALDRVSKNAAVYDVKKMTWMNGLYMSQLPINRIEVLVQPFLKKQGINVDTENDEAHKRLLSILDAVRSRVRTLEELAEGCLYFYKDFDQYDQKGVRKYFKKQGVVELLKEGKAVLQDVEPFDLENTEKAYRKLIDELQIKGAAIIHPTRLALSGRTVGPGLFDIIALLGKEKCIERMDRAIEWIEKNLD